MRIAWATPLDGSSAIGAFGTHVVHALRASGVEVDVWGPSTEDALPFGSTPYSFDPERPQVVGEYDHVIYNMGNNPAYHSQVYEASRQRSGVVVMHDRTMLDFFMFKAMHGDGPDWSEVARFAARLGHYYGAAGLAFAHVLEDPSLLESSIEGGERAFPLFEPCLANAAGIVTHSASARGLFAQRYGDLVPSVSLDLPLIFAEQYRDSDALLARSALGLPDDRLLIVTHGYSTAAKREHVLIDVFAAQPLLHQSAMLVNVGGGDAEYMQSLRSQAESLGLGDRVRFAGRVDELTLYSHIANADICVNLRYPSTEAASASLGEQLHFGKPTIVSDVGAFTELPSDVVVKVDMADEETGLARALLSLVSDPTRRTALGDRARAYAADRFSATRYAGGLIDLLREVDAAAEVLREVDALGGVLATKTSPSEMHRACRDAAADLAQRLRQSQRAASQQQEE